MKTMKKNTQSIEALKALRLLLSIIFASLLDRSFAVIQRFFFVKMEWEQRKNDAMDMTSEKFN